VSISAADTSILAIETSSSRGSVALLHGGRVEEAIIDTAREQTERLLPLTEMLMKNAGLELSRLDAIAFGRGPGSFTGLRIAAAAAQGLAMSADLPVLPVSSLAALAQGAWRLQGVERSLVCLDARMGEVYWGPFEIRADVAAALAEERIGPPEEVDAPRGSWTAVGNGFAVHRERLAGLVARAGGELADLLPSARDLLPQACRDFAAGNLTPPEAALPVYLRDERAWRKSD
jgi:tRNA threonylcarbamoyladenosine biosynthesis protein TsaB